MNPTFYAVQFKERLNDTWDYVAWDIETISEAKAVLNDHKSDFPFLRIVECTVTEIVIKP